jgi:hypothetical protein
VVVSGDTAPAVISVHYAARLTVLFAPLRVRSMAGLSSSRAALNWAGQKGVCGKSLTDFSSARGDLYAMNFVAYQLRAKAMRKARQVFIQGLKSTGLCFCSGAVVV